MTSTTIKWAHAQVSIIVDSNVQFTCTCTSIAAPNFVPPPDVTNDAPQIGIEELLQQMSIQEGGGGGQLEDMTTE